MRRRKKWVPGAFFLGANGESGNVGGIGGVDSRSTPSSLPSRPGPLVWVWNEVASGYGVLTDVFVCWVGCIMAGALRSAP
jgi:hypothetical protein